jgi:hypothetical protein
MDAVIGGDEVTLGPPPSACCFILLTFGKVDESAERAKLNAGELALAPFVRSTMD